jgi:HK97 family phage major capsid protein
MMTKERLADLQAEGQKHITDARAIADEHDGDVSEWPDEARDGYNACMAKAADTLAAIRTAKDDLAVMAKAKELGEAIGEPMMDADVGGYRPDIDARAKTLGLTVTSSPEFKACLAPFTHNGIAQIPKGTHINSSPISVKSLFTGLSSTSAGAFVVNERSDIVEMLGRKPLTVRDLVSKRRTASDAVEFVQETSHTNAAAVIAEATSSAAPTAPGGAGALVNNAGGGYKPEGAWAFSVVTTNVKTIAEWVPVTKRALQDVAQLEGLINDELARDIAETEENQIMNGDGTGENFTGISVTSGIQTQSFVTDMFTAIRKGITKLRTVGRVEPSAILMNPANAEAVDLTKDGQGQYYYGGPMSLGPRRMWGLPIIESETQTVDFCTVADWSKAVIWDREQTTVTMTDSHADFFVRNLVAILAEERLAFGVVRPSAFCTVDIVTP